MKTKALLIATAASAAIVGLSSFAYAQSAPELRSSNHIQSGAGHSGRMITGREAYAPHFRGPDIAAPFFGRHHYRHRYWEDGRWHYRD